MNKIKALLIPMMVFPFLTCCGNSVNHFVNEQQFKDALSFKDIVYLQIEMKYIAHDDNTLKIYKMSPTVCYYLSSYSDKCFVNGPSYFEKYVKKDGDNYTEYKREAENDPFNPYPADSEDFITPQSDEINAYILINEQLGLSYKDFAYNRTSKAFETHIGETEIFEESGTIALEFKNKKFISCNFKSDNDNVSIEMIYTYNKLTPDIPPIDFIK